MVRSAAPSRSYYELETRRSCGTSSRLSNLNTRSGGPFRRTQSVSEIDRRYQVRTSFKLVAYRIEFQKIARNEPLVMGELARVFDGAGAQMGSKIDGSGTWSARVWRVFWARSARRWRAISHRSARHRHSIGSCVARRWREDSSCAARHWRVGSTTIRRNRRIGSTVISSSSARARHKKICGKAHIKTSPQIDR